MTATRIGRRWTRSHRGALSLIEVVVSSTIVAVMLVAALQAVGAAKMRQSRSVDYTRGRLLAQELMAEILPLAYQDPETPTAPLGPDSGETGGQRKSFDDVDDFAGWNETAIVDRAGAGVLDLAGWQRSASVEWVAAAASAGASVGSETGLKRVTVTVRHNGVTMATLVALRAVD